MKLSGIRVLDFSRFMAGPLISAIMADHGAEVTKIEGPEGDPTRGGRRSRASQNAGDSFSVFNRGKRSIVLDLKQADGREIAEQLIRDADVLIESFSPGVAERLGIGQAIARQINPRLVYCSVTAFGQDGPLRNMAAHDPAVQALAGILPREDNHMPVIPSVSVASLCSAHIALAGILMALLSARTTGLGDYLDVSMHDVALSARPGALFGALVAERQESTPALGHAMLEPYETADAEWLCLGAGEPRFAKALLGQLGHPELISVALGEPGAAQDPLRKMLAETFRRKPLAAWMEWLEARSIGVAPVVDYAQALRHPHVRERGMLLADHNGDPHLNTPIRFLREPGKPDLRIPALGEHTITVLAEAGSRLADKGARV